MRLDRCGTGTAGPCRYPATRYHRGIGTPFENAAAVAEGAGVEVVDDPAVVGRFSSDWTGAYEGSPALLARPGDTAALAALLAGASRAGVPVTLQGGNTSLVAGAVPASNSILVRFDSLSGVEEIDPGSRSVVVRAGTTLSELASATTSLGLEPGVNLASRDSATIGGLVATNAGGERVIRYGTMGAQVTGMEFVTPEGQLVSRLAGLPKDNAGFDAWRLFPGSEGVIGAITRVRLKLWLRPTARVAILAGFPSLDAMITAFTAIYRATGELLEAADYFFSDGMDLVCEQFDLEPPLRAPAYLLIQLASSLLDEEGLLAKVGGLFGDAAVVATGAGSLSRLWRFREDHALAIARLGSPLKIDLSLPLDRLAAFRSATAELLASDPLVERCLFFGHLAEGNSHLNVILREGGGREEVMGRVFASASRFGGSIGAEHGIGRTKRKWMHLARSEAEIALMRRLKLAMDPASILNPGVLFPEAIRGG